MHKPGHYIAGPNLREESVSDTKSAEPLIWNTFKKKTV